MSSLFKRVVEAANEVNRRSSIEDLSNMIMGRAMGGNYQVDLLPGDSNFEKCDETAIAYFTEDGFKVDRTDEKITISWSKEDTQCQ